jgi:hypothetical protein
MGPATKRLEWPSAQAKPAKGTGVYDKSRKFPEVLQNWRGIFGVATKFTGLLLYCSFAYSALAAFRMGISRSASSRERTRPWQISCRKTFAHCASPWYRSSQSRISFIIRSFGGMCPASNTT